MILENKMEDFCYLKESRDRRIERKGGNEMERLGRQ
jgi:hypothetical protein